MQQDDKSQPVELSENTHLVHDGRHDRGAISPLSISRRYLVSPIMTA